MDDETSGVDLCSEPLDVLLEGGPADIPLQVRERPFDTDDGRIRLSRYGGWEHFERTDQYTYGQDGRRRLIYQWVARTKIAE